jgi:hypothetical protein
MERFWAQQSKDLTLVCIVLFQGVVVSDGLWGYESLRPKLDEIRDAGFEWALTLGCALPFFFIWLAVEALWPWWHKRRRPV